MADEVTEADLAHLRRCVELAAEAVAAGDFPFGSVLVAGSAQS
jgi:tRNA(Arg) A34 adenosine deaminase TadA